MIQSSKYPHPDNDTATNRVEAQIARIRELTKALAARDGEAFLDARKFARENVDDLDAIEENTRKALDNLIAAMDDTDRLADDGNRPAIAAALSIENMARAALIASL